MRDHLAYPLGASYHTRMTQATYTQARRKKLASNPARKARTLAERRADFESQMREFAARDGIVALTALRPQAVRGRGEDQRRTTDLPVLGERRGRNE